MRILTSWISDPCVHVLAVGLLIVYLAMGASAESQPRPDDVAYCQTCQQSHGEFDACPAPGAKTVSLAAH